MSKYKYLDKYLEKKGKNLSEMNEVRAEKELRAEEFKLKNKSKVTNEELYDMIIDLI